MTTKFYKNYGIPTSPRHQVPGTRVADQSFIWVYLEDMKDGTPRLVLSSMDRDKRFLLRDGGGGIGSEETEVQAIEHLKRYAQDKLKNKIDALAQQLAICQHSLIVLESSGLGEFEVPEGWTPAGANGRVSY